MIGRHNTVYARLAIQQRQPKITERQQAGTPGRRIPNIYTPSVSPGIVMPNMPQGYPQGGRVGDDGTNWVHSDRLGDKCGALRWGDDHVMVRTTDPGRYSRVAAMV